MIEKGATSLTETNTEALNKLWAFYYRDKHKWIVWRINNELI